MCTSPILIENPYFRRGFTIEHNGKKARHVIKGRFDFLHDTVNGYILVPCGQCSQCLSMRQGFINQRIQMESLRSELFFFTLTYANRALKYTPSRKYKIAYPFFPDIQNLFKRLRKILPHKIRTYVVSEYGTDPTKTRRPHYHGLIAVSKEDIKTFYRDSNLYCEKVLFREVFANWKRNMSKSHKFPVYMPLSDFVYKGKKHTFELHHVAPIIDHDNDISFYISKYIYKYDPYIDKILTRIKLDATICNSSRKILTSMVKPRSVMSKDFGSYKIPEVSKYIKSCVSRSGDFPSFFDINTGKSMLLAPYYRKRFVTLDYKFDKWWEYLHKVQYLDVNYSPDSYNPELLDDSFAHDWNCNALKTIQREKHLRKVKYLLSKK